MALSDRDCLDLLLYVKGGHNGPGDPDIRLVRAGYAAAMVTMGAEAEKIAPALASSEENVPWLVNAKRLLGVEG